MDDSVNVFGVYEQNHRRNWAAFWLIGMINNFHYCLVLSAADEIATSFHLKSYVALVSWASVFFGIVLRLLNAFVYANVPYNKRFLFTGFQTLVGIVLVSSAKYLGSNDAFRFFVALVGVVFCGNASTYGESVALGYMERFPSTTVGGWSSGTGMSGVLASLIYMGLGAAGLSNAGIFLVSIPLVVVYWAMYFFVIVIPDENGGPSSNWKSAPWWLQSPQIEQPQPEHSMQCIESTHLLQATSSEAPSVFWRAAFGVTACCSQRRGTALRHWWNRNWAVTCAMHRMTFFNNLNLLVVYVAEYAIQFMAPFSFPCQLVKNSSNFWLSNSFVVTQFCYQLGVLASRSSLLCLRIRRVWILSVIQVANAIFWFLQAKLLVVGSADDSDREESLAFILFAYMVFVGLFGGASYVNVFFNILELDPTSLDERAINCDGAEGERNQVTAQEKRQLMMNIGAVYAIAGISLGSFVDLIFSNTVLTTSC
jgi:battenin